MRILAILAALLISSCSLIGNVVGDNFFIEFPTGTNLLESTQGDVFVYYPQGEDSSNWTKRFTRGRLGAHLSVNSAISSLQSEINSICAQADIFITAEQSDYTMIEAKKYNCRPYNKINEKNIPAYLIGDSNVIFEHDIIKISHSTNPLASSEIYAVSYSVKGQDMDIKERLSWHQAIGKSYFH